MRLLLALLLSVGTLHAEDWPQWLGLKRDGVWRETGIVESFPKDGPKKLWTAPVGLGFAGPAVVKGKVYLTDRQLAQGAANPSNPFDTKSEISGSERVLCLDAKTGDQIWEHKYPCAYKISYAAGPRCTPIVDDGRVFTLGAMGDLYCLDATGGSEIWKKSFMKDYDAKCPVWGFAAHPLIDGEKLICLAGGSENRLVIAFDKKTGKELWTSQSCAGDFGYCPPVIYEFGGRRQLIIWHAAAVVGLDPETGKRIWIVPFQSNYALTVPMPRQVGDQLFLSSFYHGGLMLKVGRENAVIVWKSKAKGEKPNQTLDLSTIIGTPFIEGDHIYGVDSYGELRCLDLSGKRIWSTMKATRGALTPPKTAANDEPSDGERWSNAFIVKNGERFFLFNEQGDLIIANLSPKGYDEVSRTHLIDPLNKMPGRKVVWMHPAFADKCVFVRNDAEVACYSLAK